MGCRVPVPHPYRVWHKAANALICTPHWERYMLIGCGFRFTGKKFDRGREMLTFVAAQSGGDMAQCRKGQAVAEMRGCGIICKKRHMRESYVQYCFGGA